MCGPGMTMHRSGVQPIPWFTKLMVQWIACIHGALKKCVVGSTFDRSSCDQ